MRSYVTRFNKESLSIEADDKALVTAFTNGLQSGEFLFSIYKNDPKKMVDMLYKATKYMNAKDAMIAQGSRQKKRERQDDLCQDRGRKSTRTNDGRDNRRPRAPPRRTIKFTPLNTLGSIRNCAHGMRGTIL